uniref:Uncharacterized protein n=1 Tax=Parascaris equorum TaxID=6256 RepID=A0A914R1S7_PAREQ
MSFEVRARCCDTNITIRSLIEHEVVINKMSKTADNLKHRCRQ